jgi:regulator of replication initiation timing
MALGLTTATTGLLMEYAFGGLKKMFGEKEIPRGVVREMMEGVMDGLISHFQWQIDELKRKKEQLDEKNNELDIENESLKKDVESWRKMYYDAVGKKPKEKKK